MQDGLPHTINSSLPQLRSSEKNSERQERASLILLLSRLAVHYYRPDFTEGQAKLLVRDMVEDLDRYAIAEVEVAIQRYRRDAENKFFPRSGQLIKLLEDDRKERRESSRKSRSLTPANPDGRALPDGKSRPILWWTLPRKLWEGHWREMEAPDGAFVYDEETGALRTAFRFS